MKKVGVIVSFSYTDMLWQPEIRKSTRTIHPKGTMNAQLAYLLYGAGYLFRTTLLRQSIPFIGGLVINETCNLQCVQCKVANRNLPDLSYHDVRHGLQIFYRMGIRSVFIEGGEPFLWKDGNYTLEDVVQAARDIGFAVVSVYTNGTLPIRISADTVFVSLDGRRETNDRLRGKVYDRVLSNIHASECSNICINFTINAHNQHEIEAFCREIRAVQFSGKTVSLRGVFDEAIPGYRRDCFAKPRNDTAILRELNSPGREMHTNPAIKGIFFYFHTPYYGRDELFLNLDERRKIIEQLLRLKRQKFKILNSSACLKAVHKDTWKRPSRLCYVSAMVIVSASDHCAKLACSLTSQ